MIVAICGSMSFADEMRSVGAYLERKGLRVLYPDLSAAEQDLEREAKVRRKKGRDLIRRHFEHISESDAILVLNYAKNGTERYIGANTFWEIGFAHVLGKKIFLLWPPPDFDYLAEELEAVGGTVLNGDLDMIQF